MSVPFIIHGKKPRVLFLSGMHGDENMSGILFETWLHSQPHIPPFVYIPSVSPSAIKAGTRHNMFGHDINRQFAHGTQDDEAASLMKLIRSYTTSLCIDIHEDPDRNSEFYLYDSGHMTKKELEIYQNTVQTTGASLYTGVDDTIDATLGCDIDHGYYAFNKTWIANPSMDEGFASKWMIRNGVAKRVFTVEIPGQAASTLKQSIISGVIPFLLTFS